MTTERVNVFYDRTGNSCIELTLKETLGCNGSSVGENQLKPWAISELEIRKTTTKGYKKTRVIVDKDFKSLKNIFELLDSFDKASKYLKELD